MPTLEHGGSERQVALLSATQAVCGHQVHLGLLRRGPQMGQIEGSAVSVHPLPHRGHHDVGLALGILRLVRRLSPDLVQTWLTQMDVLGGLAARLVGVPWVMTERSSAGAYPWSVKHLARLRMGRLADVIVANSSAGIEYWRDHGVCTPCVRVPNSVVLDQIDDASAPSPDLREVFARPVVLFVGRFVPEKNLPFLIEALRGVLPGTDVRAILCGDGPQAEVIRSMVERAGLNDQVWLPGFREDVAGLAQAATVFVSLSRYEGQPNAVLEAMAASCAVVVSDIPAHREILDEGSAWFVEPADPASVAAAIRSALDDPAEAHRRGAAARQRAIVQSPAAVVAAYDAVYREVLNHRGHIHNAANGTFRCVAS